MYVTRQSIIPLVLPIGVVGDIPAEAWGPPIALAKDTFDVRLTVELHNQPIEPVPHYHFTLAGDASAIDEGLLAIAEAVARVIAAHTSKVTVPEGR